MLFHTPELDEAERAVIARVETVREALRYQLTGQRRWVGLLRQVMLAGAIQGSNTIEGYNVSLDDAVAAVAGEEPIDAETEAWMAVTGYRDAMTYVIQLAEDPHFAYTRTLVRGLHYMMLKYDLDKSPGRWRPGPVFVVDERNQEIVYTGPDASLVPELMGELTKGLREPTDEPAMVRAAMAHLNFVMIHPFRDGNGRMARCVQTLVLAREGIVAPPFWSIEEYLGANTDAYYKVLADVGQGEWHPENDARPWIRFVLTAHYRQAQTAIRRAHEAERRWDALSQEIARRNLPERATGPLFNAALGFRMRNVSYQDAADVSESIAGRDLKALTDAGLLDAVGERRGRFYIASAALKALEGSIRLPRAQIEDPFAGIPPTLGL